MLHEIAGRWGASGVHALAEAEGRAQSTAPAYAARAHQVTLLR